MRCENGQNMVVLTKSRMNHIEMKKLMKEVASKQFFFTKLNSYQSYLVNTHSSDLETPKI